MNASLAVIPNSQESSRPDIAWIKKNVPVLEVGKALGMRIRHRRAKCWRPETHTHGDADPSLSFYEKGNRVRCFVCDMRGGHSNIDLVMGVLGIGFRQAVDWIAERFKVPDVKVGRPPGRRSAEVVPYRVGVTGSELEFFVRSGFFGQLSPPERSVVIALHELRDRDSGLTLLSYAGIQRYAGVASTASVSRALKKLAKIHAIQIHRGNRVFGITRECSVYKVTLDDSRFRDLCDRTCRAARDEISQEREYRKSLRHVRASKPARLNPGGGLRPPDPPRSFSLQKEEQANPATCEGPNLSSPSEAQSNKSLHAVKHEIGISGFPSPHRSFEEQKRILREKGFLPEHKPGEVAAQP